MAEKKKNTKKEVKKKPAVKKTAKKVVAKTATKPIAKRTDKKNNKREIVVKKDSGGDRIVFAHSNYIRSSARKARLVIDMIRARNAVEVVEELHFSDKEMSLPIRKTVESAIANAVHNYEMAKKKLFVAEAYVNEAPTYKRGRAGSRGRYKKLLKRNCHITIGLREKE